MRVVSHYKPSSLLGMFNGRSSWPVVCLPRNFFGGLFRSPADGCTTQRSSIRLEMDSLIFKQEKQHKRANKQTDSIIHILVLYPSVLMNPLTVPSAKRETISPICRRLVCWVIVQRKLRIYARRISEQFQHWIHKNADAEPIVISLFSWLFPCTALQRNPP